MRPLAGLLLSAAVFFGIYYYSVKRMPTSEPGTVPTQEISLTGVKADLLEIAEAERAYMVLSGHCASFEELISSKSLSLSATERDGYSYSVECSGEGFTATAHHVPAPAGSPIRYPTLAIDGSMQVHEVH